jgi:hypothetical protein
MFFSAHMRWVSGQCLHAAGNWRDLRIWHSSKSQRRTSNPDPGRPGTGGHLNDWWL